MAVSSGKLLAAGMLGLGLVASVLSISYRRQQTHRALALWGPEQAVTVATAPVVKAVWFDPPLAQSNEAMPSEVVERAPRQSQNLSGLQGFKTVRQLLVEDSSFDWQSDSLGDPLGWTYGLEFSDPTGPEVLVLLDPTTGMVSEAKNHKTAKLQTSVARQLKTFLQQQFADQGPDVPAE
jgi:hypothetical protein